MDFFPHLIKLRLLDQILLMLQGWTCSLALVMNQSLEFMASFPVFTICSNSLLPLSDSLHCLLPHVPVLFTNSI